MVPRLNTWVWGTGHTDNNGIEDSGEAVLITLGDGTVGDVNEVADDMEDTVAVGLEDASTPDTNTLDFEVYALTHSGLAVDYVFEPDGNSGNLIVDVGLTDPADSDNRMALVTNGQAGNGTAYPRPIFSSRYFDDSTVRLQRRRFGQNFPAWVQGIDFTSVTNTVGENTTDPPAVVNDPTFDPFATGYELPSGTSMTLSFDVDVVDPIPGGVTDITNTAELVTPGLTASVTDTVIRPAVEVEPNGSGYVLENLVFPNTRTIRFFHKVTNEGDVTDSFDLVVGRDQDALAVSLIDPATELVISTDDEGDGIWDSGDLSPNTGSLAPGGSSDYVLEATVDASATGPTDTIELRATSTLRSIFTARAFDDVSVQDPAIPGAADVLLTPAHQSGVAPAGVATDVAYTLEATNLGAAQSFSIFVFSSIGTPTVYQDSDGDGVFSPGDTTIITTGVIATSGTKRLFVVVSIPNTVVDGDIDLTNITLAGQTDPDVIGVASATTTIGDGNSDILFDLSGGGTQWANPAMTDTLTFPGNIRNLDPSNSVTLEFSHTGTFFPGDHRAWLFFDFGGGMVEVARDDEGDGVFDFIDTSPLPVSDGDGDKDPSIDVPADTVFAYEFRREALMSLGAQRDPVTLTATLNPSDSVTATMVILNPSLAVIDSVVAYGTDDGVVVEWVTASEHGTVGFVLQRLDESDGQFGRVNRRLVPGLLHARNGGVYRFMDPAVAVGELVTYRLVEHEASGGTVTHGPYEIVVYENAETAGAHPALEGDNVMPGLERVARPRSKLSTDRGAAKESALASAGQRRLQRRGPIVKITTRERGLYFVDAPAIASALGMSADEIEDAIGSGNVELTNRTRRIATLAAEDHGGLYFYGEPVGAGVEKDSDHDRLDSLYTEKNVYWLRLRAGVPMGTRDGRAPAPVTGLTFPEVQHAEGNQYVLTHLFEDPDADFWFWDYRIGGVTLGECSPALPPPACNVNDMPVPSPGVAAVAGEVGTLTVDLHGATDASAGVRHEVTVSLNGTELGRSSWEGLAPHTATFEVDLALLADGDNVVNVVAAPTGEPFKPSSTSTTSSSTIRGATRQWMESSRPSALDMTS